MYWIHITKTVGATPSMRRVIRLASMEVRSEATEDIVIFFKLLNEMLQIVGKKEEGYKFNPRYILCDEAGGNIRGIKEALGLEFAAARVVTCQWHFMNKMNNRIQKIGRRISRRVCYISWSAV